eukprot:TRINITY_DN49148_c0_g1_i3.p1 TRINITY_DN49148_c0_g1~~TRINITY_DN49148_c0_g1_i3.p1  ORF type:complete len:138 (-),score=22.17 TRINITY_DN49148_c0_g1_i3:133-546(-)
MMLRCRLVLICLFHGLCRGGWAKNLDLPLHESVLQDLDILHGGVVEKPANITEIFAALDCECSAWNCGYLGGNEIHLHSKTCVGRLPAEICKLQQLEAVVLSINQLTGEIPECICEMKNLEWLSHRACDTDAHLLPW